MSGCSVLLYVISSVPISSCFVSLHRVLVLVERFGRVKVTISCRKWPPIAFSDGEAIGNRLMHRAVRVVRTCYLPLHTSHLSQPVFYSTVRANSLSILRLSLPLLLPLPCSFKKCSFLALSCNIKYFLI